MSAKYILTFCVLCSSMFPALALPWSGTDVSGLWTSVYDFDVVVETMTANIQQVDGEAILGSFSVAVEPTGDEYSGIIFGSINGNEVKAYYLGFRDNGAGDSVIGMSYADGTLTDKDTIKGTFYYQDTNSLEGISGPYEATRI